MGTDFFDDDLLDSERADSDELEQSDGVPIRSITEVSLSRLARQKREMTEQVSGTVSEIERLRRRQEELEREKESLQNLGRKQQEYEQSKRQILERLERGIILTEKEETQAARMSELLTETRARFRETLAEVKAIREEDWPEEDFEGELDKATVLVENAARTYRKALAQIDAVSWSGSASGRDVAEPLQAAPRESSLPSSFGFWMKVGLAASLPLLIVLCAFFVAYLLFMGIIGF